MEKKQEDSGFDIFLSYASEDRDRARRLAEALKSQGWSVFWDRTIPAGKTWRQVISGALEGARCVVVAWSDASVKSRWVQEEADWGAEREILIPVLIDDVKPPLGFGTIQAIDLTNWDPARPQPAFDKFIVDLTSMLGPSPKAVQEVERRKAKEEQLQAEAEAKGKAEEEAEPARNKAAKEVEEQHRQAELDAAKRESIFSDQEVQSSLGYSKEPAYEFWSKSRVVAGYFRDMVKTPTARRSVLTAIAWLLFGLVIPWGFSELFVELGLDFGTAKNGGLAFGAGLFSVITVLILYVCWNKLFLISRFLYLLGAIGFTVFALIAVGQLLFG